MIRDHDHSFKMVFVGNQSVGKSSLFVRFCDNVFVDNYLATIGVDFKFKMINVGEDICKVQIWDTAGQQRFRTITSAYYRSANAILIIYDVSDLETFKQIQKYWLQQAKKNSDANTIICIVGNKIDKKKEIQDANVQQLVGNANLFSYFVSAKTGQGIEKMFQEICQQLIAKQKSKPHRIKQKKIKIEKFDEQAQGEKQPQKANGCCK